MGWERKRGKLQELNAPAARVARRPTSSPTGRPRRRRRRTSATWSRSTPTRGCRAGAVGAARRHDRPPAQPARLRPGAGPGRRGATASSSRGSPRRCRPSTTRRSSSGSSPGSAGIDPYASAVSDVYQDLFGEGSFTGKGIYDVDAFDGGDGRPGARERAAQPRPVRGHLRPGRASSPTSSCSTSSRRTTSSPPPASTAGRAATGSSCPWILGPGPRRRRAAAAGRRCPASRRWKMSTTCAARCRRRSPLATLVAAWTLPAVRPGRGPRFVLAVVIMPAGAARPRRAAAAPTGDLEAQPPAGRRRRTSRLAAAQVGLGITFLAHQAWLMVDAIVRTLARLLRHAPAPARVDDGRPGEGAASTSTSRGFYRQMAGGVVARRRRRRSLVARPEARRAPGSPRRSSSCGCSRRSSPGGSACRRAESAAAAAVGRGRRRRCA